MTEQGRMVKVDHGPGLPNVEIEEAILNPEFRYGVRVDSKKLGSLLFASGVTAVKVPQYNIAVKIEGEALDGEAPKDKPVFRAQYEHETKTVTVFVERFLDGYYKAKDDAAVIKSGAGHLVEHPFYGFLKTKRLPAYLMEAPAERSATFVNNLFTRVLNKQFREALIHEANHIVVVDEINRTLSVSGLIDSVARGIHLVISKIKRRSDYETYIKDPIEVKARKAEKDKGLNKAADGALVLGFNKS